MRKQARRLWLGDWQRDQEPGAESHGEAGQSDLVELIPDEGDGAPAGDRSNIKRAAAGVLLIAAVFFVALALAPHDQNNPLASRQSQQAPLVQIPRPQPQPQQPQPQQGFGGPDLTTAAAIKAAKAAVAKFPGDVERVTGGFTGSGYIVHVIQPDGNEVHVVVGPDFKVQGSDAGSGGGAGPNTFGPGTSQ